MLTSDLMELREEEIARHMDAAMALLDGFDHAPRVAKAAAVAAPERSPGVGTRRAFRSTTPGLVTQRTTRPEGVHLIDRVSACDAEDPLMSVRQAAVLQALRRGLAIGLALGEGFAEQAGLTDLKRKNLEGALPADRKAEFSELLTAEALIVLHASANALVWLLAGHASEVSVEVGEVEEFLTDNASLGLHGALWQLDQALAVHAAGDEEKLVPTVTAIAEALMEKAARRADGLARVAPFSAASWRVEADDLTIRGFTPARKAGGPALTMQFKKPHEVVGNHIAKYQAMKLAKMLMAYDFDRRLNPFADLGGFIFTFMGDGAPGTGKTTLIQMMAGLINEYCQNAGYPFRYQNFGIDNIDSYQGKSGQNAKAFVQNVLDPSVIGFGTIDDIDQIAGRRGDRQSSSGQQEITAVLMEAFAGASTVVRGNATFGMFSNHAENIDDALRQRAGTRLLIEGPRTQADYIEILGLLMGRRHDIPFGSHDASRGRVLQQAVSDSYAGHARPEAPAISAIFADVSYRHGPLQNISDLGSYLFAIAQADPRFTGRAIKNITDAVKARAMDFDMPDDWFDRPGTFLHQPYQRKIDMIEELRRPITPEMVLQEINRYADSEWRYSESADETAITDTVRGMQRMAEAKRRFERGD